jgi:hypothetical protein
MVGEPTTGLVLTGRYLPLLLRGFLIVSALLSLLASDLPAYAGDLPDTPPAGWWWFYGQTPAQAESLLSVNKRPVKSRHFFSSTTHALSIFVGTSLVGRRDTLSQ